MPALIIDSKRHIHAFDVGRDVFGNELKIGDLVAHSSNGYGIVTKLCDATVRAYQIRNIEVNKEYGVVDVKKEGRWRMPAWGYSVVSKCTSCDKKIVEILPSQDFIVEYTLVTGHKFYAKFDFSYDHKWFE